MDDRVKGRVLEVEPSGLPPSDSLSVSPKLAGRPPHPRQRRLIFLAAVIVLLAVAAAFVWQYLRTGQTPQYLTATVGRGDVSQTVTATGTVNPLLTIIVGTYVSGVIQEVTCDFNTSVKKGQVCAKIDPRPYQTIVEQDKANLDAANAQLTKDTANLSYARLNYGRNADLLKKQAVSQDVVDNVKNALDQAQAQIDIDKAAIEQRQAELDSATVNLSYTEITSPVDGTVISRNVTTGQTVAASLQTPTLFLIATDLTKMQVDANVSESDIGAMKSGEKARFSVDAFPTRTFAGTVGQVRRSPQTVQNVVTYDVVISVDNADLALIPGMTAATTIVVDERTNVLRVPDQALRYVPSGLARGAGRRQGGAREASSNRDESGARANQRPADANSGRIWILQDGEAIPAAVVAGLDDGAFTEIVQGAVKAGDKAIVGEGGGQTSSAQQQRPNIPRL
jgi:HlyD family secretion protein